MLRAAAATLILAASLLPVQAQVSPNCQRNGRRDYCAFTPGSDSAAPSAVQDVGWLVFADHTVYALKREESSCRDRGAIRTCQAWIAVPSRGERLIPARYLGTAYEGGYRHDYLAPGLSLSFTYLD